MAHVIRDRIDAIKAAVTGLSTTGANVFESPNRAIASGKVPAVIVAPVSESLTQDTHDFGDSREVTIAVSALATDPEVRDQVQVEIEVAMAALYKGRIEADQHPLHDGLRNTQWGEQRPEGSERVFYLARLDYAVPYRVRPDDPETDIDLT